MSLDGSPVAKGGYGFDQNGKLAKWQKNKDTGAFTTDFTRISAVMTLGPDFAWIMDEVRFVITHKAVVVHNPFSTHRIDPKIFGDFPQWVIAGETMGWNDHYRGP